MTIILVSLLAASLLFYFCYLFSIEIIYKRENNRLIDFRNTFVYEGASKFPITKGFLFASLLTTLGAYIFYSVKCFDVSMITMTVFVAALSFCIGAAPFVRFTLYREHLYLDVGLLLFLFAVGGIQTYYSFNLYMRSEFTNTYCLISLIVSAIILLISLVFVFAPRLFDLKTIATEKGEMRKQIIPLALLEWTSSIFIIASLIPLILLSVGK